MGALLVERDLEKLFTYRGRLLVHIIETPGVTVRKLITDLFLSERSVWGILSELKKAGLLRSTRLPEDKRTFQYFATPEGLERLKRLTEGKDFI